MTSTRTKTILIAVGGPTCSGKTSLVKHLCKILPEGDSFIVHQDDFAPVSQRPQSMLLLEGLVLIYAYCAYYPFNFSQKRTSHTTRTTPNGKTGTTPRQLFNGRSFNERSSTLKPTASPHRR